MDGDGNLDLLITGRDSNADPQTTLYLGDGEGGYTSANAGLTGVEQGSSSMGDVDNDGNLDLLITGESDGGRITKLYLGDGQGNFTEANAGLTNMDKSSSSFGDVNNDGNLDLVVAGVFTVSPVEADIATTLYLGDGEGGFTAAGTNLVAVQNGSSSFGDVNDDGNLDLLVTGDSELGSIDVSPTAALYLGDGNGGFSFVEAGLEGVELGSSNIADVDRDGNLDLLITGNASAENVDPTATLYMGDGEGGFTEANAGLNGESLSTSSVGDFNRDGHLDLFITGSEFADPNVYLGNGDGSFVKINAGLPDVTQGSSSVIDANGDRHVGLLITGENKPARVFLGAGHSRFAEAETELIPVARGASSFGDVDGDGNLDLVITGPADLDGDGFEEPSATLYLGDGQGGFTETDAGLGGNRDGSISMGDADNDGNLDILLTGDSEATLYLGDGQGNFDPAGAGLTGVNEGASSVGDVNGDGNLDLLITGNAGSGTDPNLTARLYLGNGQGNFDPAGAGLTGVAEGSSSIGDVNDDGNLDLLVTGGTSLDFIGGASDPTTTLYLGDGQGDFTEANAGLTGVLSSSSVIVDVDGDGNLDILIAGDDGTGPTAKLYLGDGQGEFTEANTGLSGAVPSSLSLGDVDADGDLDLLIAGDANGGFSSGGESAMLFLGDGQGRFSKANAELAGVFTGSASFGDINNNGDQDLIVTGNEGESGSERSATLYENLGESDLLEALAAQTVGSDGTADFSGTGVSINFSGTSGSGEVTVQRFSNKPSSTQGIAESTVSNFRFVLSTGGDLTFDDNTEVRLDVGTLSGVGDPTTVTIYKRSVEDSGRFIPLPTTGTGDELVATSGSFSEFVLASDSDENPLPVELASFEGTTMEQGVRLTWQTASETSNAGFEVQRRVDAEEHGSVGAWTQVGFVDSKAAGGTTDEALNYRFTDEDLPFAADSLTYRLKQVDLDGSTSLTDPVTVERAVEALQLKKTFPNPARTRATVQFAVPERQDVRLELYDVLGRQVRTVQQGEVQGRQELQVDLSGLASGTYFLRLRAEGETETQRLTVVR